MSGSNRGIREHVHECQGSVKFIGQGSNRHNHRFAGGSGEAIPGGRYGHVYKLFVNYTDNTDHHHQICGTTGIDVQIPGTDKHVHAIEGTTTVEDRHCHDIEMAIHVQAPTV